MNHSTTELLMESRYGLKRSPVPGVDEVTSYQYRANLENRPESPQEHIRKENYRVKPLKRIYKPETKDTRGRWNRLAGMYENTCRANEILKKILFIFFPERNI